MPLARGIGRMASFTGRKAGAMTRQVTSARTGRFALFGGAAALGGISAVGDSEGPYRQSIMPDIQEGMFGDPNALGNSMRAGLVSEITKQNSDQDPGGYYYGRNVDQYGMADRANRRQSRGQNPVSGELVFGLWNLRQQNGW